MYNETLGKWHFWLSTIFVNVTFFPMHFLGLAGMPRRIPDYSTQFANFNEVASIGAIGFGLSQLLFVYIIVTCARGEKATDRVWEAPRGLEWTVPSPAPYHTFDSPPVKRTVHEEVFRLNRRPTQEYSPHDDYPRRGCARILRRLHLDGRTESLS